MRIENVVSVSYVYPKDAQDVPAELREHLFTTKLYWAGDEDNPEEWGTVVVSEGMVWWQEGELIDFIPLKYLIGIEVEPTKGSAL